MTEHTEGLAEAIRRRAYEISQGPDAGTPEENWLRAEEELRRPTAAEDPIRHEEAELARHIVDDEVHAAHLSAFTHP